VTRRGDLHYYGAGSTPAPPPPDQTFAMVGAVSGSTSGAPMIVIDGMVPPRLRATLHRRPNLVPVVAELTGAFDRQWQDELNSPGTASMSLGNEDPWATQIQPGDVIRFEDDGWAVFSWIVREIEHVKIARGEEHEQITKFSGEGLLSILSEAVVYPANSLDALPRGPEGMSMRPIEDKRYFSWQSNAYDESKWAYAKLYAQYWPGQDDTPPGEPANSGMHAGCTVWPLPGCWRVTTNLGDYWIAPGGWCYFRHLFWIGDDDPTRDMVIFGLADDESKWWFDGMDMYETIEWTNNDSDLVQFYVDVAPGWHYLAVAVHNSELGPMHSEMFGRDINPFSVMFAGYRMDANTGDVLGGPIFQSDGTTRIVDYPPGPPGWTPGQVIDRILVESGWSRKTIPYVQVGFTHETDSDGNPWPMTTDIATDVGTDYLTFLQEICETYVDIWMEPSSFTLHAWVKGMRGSHLPDVELRAVTNPLDPFSGNLAGLTYKRVD
jgi:hypothetical protein